MSIHFEHALEVACTPERAFALIDDFDQTPRWLERCTGIETLTDGPNAVGTKVRYSYRDVRRSGTMDGEVTVRVPNERLTLRCADAVIEVTVDFRVERGARGARLVHAIDMKPRTLTAKLFAPLIRGQLPKQTVQAMERLRQLLEASS
jgi:carbon monoxide dehydrogenase subunit G